MFEGSISPKGETPRIELPATRLIVLMGVSGAGKTTIGTLLALQLKALFADADDYHPAVNKAKMAAGHPLTDEDRQPWLETLNHLLLGWAATGISGVLACSALKDRYRQTLTQSLPEGALVFCLLELPQATLEARLAQRHHEFMTPKLLASQLATLEVPGDAIVVVNDRTPAEVVSEIITRLNTVFTNSRGTEIDHGTSTL